MKNSRRKAERLGWAGETLAALYLRCKLFRILRHRYKSPVGEIDLVVRRGALIAFVEVKTRGSSRDLEAALNAVNKRRIVRAANHFLSQNSRYAGANLRFDVIFLAPWSWPRHLTHAFDGEN